MHTTHKIKELSICQSLIVSGPGEFPRVESGEGEAAITPSDCPSVEFTLSFSLCDPYSPRTQDFDFS